MLVLCYHGKVMHDGWKHCSAHKGWTPWGEEAPKLCRQHLNFHLPHHYWLTFFRSVPAEELSASYGTRSNSVSLLPQLFILKMNKTYYDWTEWSHCTMAACFITHWTSVEYLDIQFFHCLAHSENQCEKALKPQRILINFRPKPYTLKQNVMYIFL